MGAVRVKTPYHMALWREFVSGVLAAMSGAGAVPLGSNPPPAAAQAVAGVSCRAPGRAQGRVDEGARMSMRAVSARARVAGGGH